MKNTKITIVLFSMFILLLGLTIYTGLGVMADEPEVLLKKTTLVYDENSGIVIDNGDITFNDKNQTVSYKLLLENTQDYDVKVSDIKLSTPTEKFLEYEVENNIDIIESNSTKELILSLETTGIKGWGRNFKDKLTANISFEKVEKPVVEEPLPEAPATNTEELISQTKEIEIKNITKDTIEFTEDFKVEKGEKVAVWIYSEPIFLGYFDVIEENGVKKIAGLEEALEKANIKSGDHTIAITTEEETIGYISVYIDEEKEILKENPSPDVSNKDENIVEEEIENVVPNPNTSDKELIVILGLLTFITGMLVIVVSRNKISRYAVLVILLGTTITTTNAEKLIDIPLTINVNFKSQNVMEKSYVEASDGALHYHKYWSYYDQIKRIFIKNETTNLTNVEHEFDVSEKQNGRVKAYLVINEENTGYYDLYIVTDGILYFNEIANFYFKDMKNLDSIDNLEGVDTSNVVEMRSMFNGTGYNSDKFSLDVSSFNTSNVTDISNMFFQTGYSNQKFTLDVSNFDTSKATNMANMFSQTGYSSLLFTLDLSNFDTSNVTTMNNMFFKTGYNSPVFTLNVSNFDTSKVTDMNDMFSQTGYSSEKFTLDLSSFNTKNVTNMNRMFYEAGYSSPLFTLDISNFDTSNVKDMGYMFCNMGHNSKKLILDVSNFNTKNVTNMTRMFMNVAYLHPTFTLDVSNFDTSNVTNMAYMFSSTGYSSSEFILDLSNFNTQKVTTMECMFQKTGYSSEKFTLDISNFNTENVTNMEKMFINTGYSSKIFTLDISSFNTKNVTNMIRMFAYTGYSNPNFTLDLGELDTSSVTSMKYMLVYAGYNSTKFNTSITISNPNISDYSKAFSNCMLQTGSQLVVNYVEGASTLANKIVKTKSSGANVIIGTLSISPDQKKKMILTASQRDNLQFKDGTFRNYKYNKIRTITFQDTINIPSNVIEVWDFSATGNNNIIAYVVASTYSNTQYDLYIQSNEQIYANTDMSYWFSEMQSLIEINNINLLNTSNVTNMKCMFCYSYIRTLDLRNFDTSKVTNMEAMFSGSIYLSSVELSNFNTSNVTNMRHMFSDTSISRPNLRNWDTSKVTDMSYMFAETTTFYIDLSNFDTSNVTNMSHMFYNSPNIETTITIKNPNTKSYDCMFSVAATEEDGIITVNYTSETSSLVDDMINTKTSDSRIVKGSLIK